MANIRATCGDCGNVEMTSDNMVVRICVDDSRGSYVFQCPGCEMCVTKPADERTINLLIASGVRLEHWRLPEELREPRGEGGQINYNDIIDFHQFLGEYPDTLAGHNVFQDILDELYREQLEELKNLGPENDTWREPRDFKNT